MPRQEIKINSPTKVGPALATPESQVEGDDGPIPIKDGLDIKVEPAMEPESSIDMSMDEAIVIKDKSQVLAIKTELSLSRQASGEPAQDLQLKRRMSIIIDPTGISKKGGKHVYQHKQAFIFASLASIFFATCNIAQGYMSIKHSYKGIYPGFAAMILQWFIYHLILYLATKNNPRPSSYKDAITGKFVFQKVMVPIRRALVQLAIQITIMMTFSYSSKSGINQGIASSIFSTCLIFVAAYFYFKEGQKLSIWDGVGIVMVMACVALISLSGNSEKSETAGNIAESEDTALYKILTIGFAVLAGFVLAVNSMDVHACLQLGADPLQMNIDAFFLFGVFLIPFFAYEQAANNLYVLSDILCMTLFVITVTLGTITLTKALQVGLAGPIQAIECLKAVWQTIATIFLFGEVPTILQGLGCGIGLLGVILMVLMKHTSAKVSEEPADKNKEDESQESSIDV